MAYCTDDATLLNSTCHVYHVPVLVVENRYFGKIKDWDKSKYQNIAALMQVYLVSLWFDPWISRH